MFGVIYLSIYKILLLACCWKCLKVSVFCFLFLFSVLCPVFLLSFLPSHLRPACGVNSKDKSRWYVLPLPPPPLCIKPISSVKTDSKHETWWWCFNPPPPPQPYIKTCFQGHDRHQTREWWWCSTPHTPITLKKLPVARSTAKTRLGGGVLHLPPPPHRHPPPPPPTPLRIKTCFQCQD